MPNPYITFLTNKTYLEDLALIVLKLFNLLKKETNLFQCCIVLVFHIVELHYLLKLTIPAPRISKSYIEIKN